MSISSGLKRLRRGLYGLRRHVPGLRRRHQLESMVGPLGYWRELQNYQFNTLCGQGLHSDHHLLDIGCGPLQGGASFIRYLERNCYVGVDRHDSVIAVAREEVARLRLTEKTPLLLRSDTFGDDQLGERKFDRIWMSQILYYFDDPTMGRLFEMAKRRLKPGGKLIGDILGPDGDRRFLKDSSLPAHSVASLGVLASKHGLVVESLGRIGNFGYPRGLALHKNELLTISSAA